MCVYLLKRPEGCNTVEPVMSSSDVQSAWRVRKEKCCCNLGVPVGKVVASRQMLVW